MFVLAKRFAQVVQFPAGTAENRRRYVNLIGFIGQIVTAQRNAIRINATVFSDPGWVDRFRNYTLPEGVSLSPLFDDYSHH